VAEERAVLAGGCFWGVQHLLRRQEGVVSTRVGVVPARDFWEAEPEHQDYLLGNPGGYTCHFIRPEWKLPKRKVPSGAL